MKWNFEKCHLWNQHLSAGSMEEGYACRVVVVPALPAGRVPPFSHSSGHFFPHNLGGRGEKEKIGLVHQSWRAASPCPRDPTTAGNSDFPSAFSTSFKRHRDTPKRLGGTAKTTPLPAQTPEPPSHTGVQRGKDRTIYAEHEIVKLQKKSSRPRFEDHLKYGI